MLLISNCDDFVYFQGCGKVGRLITINKDGDLVVLHKGKKKYTYNPVCCNPVDNPELAKQAPSLPTSDSEDEEEETDEEEDEDDSEDEGDMVPGDRVRSKPDDNKGQKQKLKGKLY